MTADPLLDKRGHKLKGNARKMRELKLRDGKGPRPPEKKKAPAAAATGDIAPSSAPANARTNGGDTGPKSTSWGERLARIW